MSDRHKIAIEIVREFSKRSYNASTWEKMISQINLKPSGCLLDALQIPCPVSRRDEVSFYAARALDREFPIYKNSAALWESKNWSETEFRRCVEVVETSAISTLQNLPGIEAIEECGDCPLQHEQLAVFVPWHRFRYCTCSPSVVGLYLFANFTTEPEPIVDPLSERVIYIGMSAGDSIASRLRAFRRSALGYTGHSAGYTYRTEYYADSWSKLTRFENIFVSWCMETSPRTVEAKALSDYAHKWGQLPALNRQY